MTCYRLMPKNAEGRLDPAALEYAGWMDFDPLAGDGPGPVVIQHTEPLSQDRRRLLLESVTQMFPGRGACFLPASVVRVEVIEQRHGRAEQYAYAIRPLASLPRELVGVGDFEGQRFAVRVVPRNPWGNRPLVCFAEDFPPIPDEQSCRELVGEMIRRSLDLDRYIVARSDRRFAQAVRLRSAAARPARRERTGRRG